LLQKLIRKHPQHLGLISFIGHDAFPKAALPRARLRSQNVAGKCVVANHFASARLFEPLGRTLMGLQLWHKYLDWRELLEVRLLQDRRRFATTFFNVPHISALPAC
jgi:hypothetical protein